MARKPIEWNVLARVDFGARAVVLRRFLVRDAADMLAVHIVGGEPLSGLVLSRRAARELAAEIVRACDALDAADIAADPVDEQPERPWRRAFPAPPPRRPGVPRGRVAP